MWSIKAGTLARSVCVGGVLAAAVPATAASVITASYGSSGPSASRPGFASVEWSTGGFYGFGSAHEFAGGVATFASGAAAGAAGFPNIQVNASARFDEAFRVRDRSGLVPAGGTVFYLDFSVDVSGTNSMSTAPVPGHGGTYCSSAQAKYSYGWRVGSFGGGGSVDQRADDRCQNPSFISGQGADGSGGGTLIVRLDDAIATSFTSEAFIAATGVPGGASASATADFSHTLIWGGIHSFRAEDANGQAIALPEDFRLELVGDTSGFDYWNAAVSPLAAVPEPAAWTMMLAGFGVIGGMARRRTAPRPTLLNSIEQE